MAKQKALLGVVSIMVCEVLFGFSFLFTKTITASVSALTLLSWRFIIAFIVINLCALTGLIKINLRRKSVAPLILVAALHPILYFIGETIGIRLTTASESATVIACIPVVALLLSTVILKEPPTRLQAAGIAVSMAGIMVIVLARGIEATFSLFGYLMLFSAVFSYGLFAVYSQKTAQFTSAEKTYAMVALGAVVFTGAALIENARGGTLAEFAALPLHSPEFLVAILYLGVGCSVVAFLLNNISLATIGTNRSASFAGLTTIVAVLAGIIIMKEQYSIFQGIGAALVLGGVYLANMMPKLRTMAIESKAEPETLA